MEKDWVSILEDSRLVRGELIEKWGIIPTSIWSVNWNVKAIDKTEGIQSSKLRNIERGVPKTSGAVLSATGSRHGSLSRFPQDLCRFVVKFYTEEKLDRPGYFGNYFPTVLDPFAGHNSRMESTWLCNRNYVGWDISNKFMKMNKKVVEELKKQNAEGLFPKSEAQIELVLNDSRNMDYKEQFDFAITSPPYWNIECVTGETKIIIANGVNKRADEIQVGDMLLSYDGNQVVETRVVSVFNREIGPSELYRIETEYFPFPYGRNIRKDKPGWSTPIPNPRSHKVLYITGNHPVFTRRGWVKTKDLTTEDELLLAGVDDKQSFMMSHYHPIFTNSELRVKQAERIRKYDWAWLKINRPEIFHRIAKMGHGRSNWDGKFNRLERRCQECGATNSLLVHHLTYEPEVLVVLCQSCHRKFHIRQQRRDRKGRFTSDCPHWVRIAKLNQVDQRHIGRKLPIKVYNFRCEPYDAYFAKWILVHNCYGDEAGQLGELGSYNTFLDGLTKVFENVYNGLKYNTFFAVESQDFLKGGIFYTFHSDVIDCLRKVGFKIWDIIIEDYGNAFLVAFPVSIASLKKVAKLHAYLIIAKKEIKRVKVNPQELRRGILEIAKQKGQTQELKLGSQLNLGIG